MLPFLCKTLPVQPTCYPIIVSPKVRICNAIYQFSLYGSTSFPGSPFMGFNYNLQFDHPAQLVGVTQLVRQKTWSSRFQAQFHGSCCFECFANAFLKFFVRQIKSQVETKKRCLSRHLAKSGICLTPVGNFLTFKKSSIFESMCSTVEYVMVSNCVED